MKFLLAYINNNIYMSLATEYNFNQKKLDFYF